MYTGTPERAEYEASIDLSAEDEGLIMDEERYSTRLVLNDSKISLYVYVRFH